MASHAREAFVLIDPVQDYEETMTILGVYGSLQAAQMALPRLRRLPYREGGQYEHSPSRVSQVEQWAGDQILGRWEFDPAQKPRWRTLIEPKSPISGSGS